MKRIGQIYQYRYGSEEALECILKNVERVHKEYFHKNPEIYFEPVSIYYICAGLLEMAKMPENPHSLNVLQKKYEQVKEENEENLPFSVDELFSEGWLVRTEEEWLWNNNPYEYGRLTSFSGQREEKMVCFLKALIDIPYKDGIFPYICEEEIGFRQLLEKTGVSVDWLLEKNILIRKESALCINTFSQEWEDYGSRALSRKYREWNCAEDREQLERWIHCCEFFTRCWEPEKYIEEKDELILYCLEKLEQEVSTWEQEAVLVTKAMKISSNRLQERFDISIPAYGMEHQSFMKHYFEYWCRLGEGHSRRNIYYGICTRNYQFLDKELRQRFRRILKKPCFEILYFHLAHGENMACMADCMGDVGLFFSAVCNIFHCINNSALNDEVKAVYIKQIVKPIWDICYNGVHQSDAGKWIENFAELLLYFYDEGDCNKNGIHRHRNAYSNNCVVLLENFLQCYFEDIYEVDCVDEKLTEYLLEKLSNAENHNAQIYFGVLMLLGKFSEQFDGEENRRKKLLDAMLRGLIIWIELAGEKELLLSTVSWTLFSEKVWHDVLIQNCGRLQDILGLLSVKKLKKTKVFHMEKSLILGAGRLALLGLYFSAVCLTELRNKLPAQTVDLVEKFFVKEFIRCQNEWALFSGENIRLGDSAIILSKCMQALSTLSLEKKNTCMEQIEMETAVDTVFWLEYVQEPYIKDKLIQILTAAQKENLFENVRFIPTWQQAVDNLLEICFSESEDAEENSRDTEQMLEFVEYALENFKEALSHKPESVRKDYQEWLESVRCRVMLLKKQEEEILSSGNSFYKGIIWLNSDELEKIQEAKKIYVQKKDVSVSWWSNYLIACVLEIVKKKEIGQEYHKDLENLKKEFSSKISDIKNIYARECYTAYFYNLFLYLKLEMHDEFWDVYRQMPKEMRQDKKIAIYVIEAFLASGNVSEAEKHLEQLQQVYGKSKRIAELQERVVKAEQKIEKPQLHTNMEHNTLTRIEMRNFLQELRDESNSSLAEIIVKEQEFSLLGNGSSQYRHEIHIVSMVCRAMKKLQDYRINLIHNRNVATEDTYNRTLKEFFNMSEDRFLGFSMVEQSQNGITHTVYHSGETGVGRRDLMIRRNSMEVALLEGIKLNCLDKTNIEIHLGKLEAYDAERVPVVIMAIYGYMSDEEEFWNKYIELLKEYKQKRQFDIVEVDTTDALRETEFVSGIRYIVKTTHKYRNFSVVAYHIMITVAYFD